MKAALKCLAVAGTLLIVNQLAFAVPVNITGPDRQLPNGATAPWAGKAGLNAGGEDNETEPGTYTGDVWDLEAFVRDGNNLSIVGTFDFLNGNVGTGTAQPIGDLFVGKFAANHPPGACMTLATMAYYVILNIAGGTYTIMSTPTGFNGVSDIHPSEPWTGIGGAAVGVPGTLTYQTGVADPFGLGLKSEGALHNIVTLQGFNLSGDMHITYKCGNDEMDTPDGGLTIIFLGMSFAGLQFISRKLRK